MVNSVLNIFTQVLNGLKSITFDFDIFTINAYQVLVGIAVLTIACKLVFSNVFEKVPHFATFIHDIRPLEVQADSLARKNIKRRELNLLAWRYENDIRAGER